MQHAAVSSSRLVGRSREVDLVASVARNRGREGRNILVTGGPGSGKTAVVRAALDGFPGEILWVNGPAEPLRDAWSGMLDVRAAMRSSKALAPASIQVAPELVRHQSGEIDEDTFLQRMLQIYCGLPRRRNPVVFVVDDVASLDPQSARALAHMLRHAHLFDVSHVLTCDPSRVPAALAEVDTVDLAPLDDAALGAMVSAVCGHAPRAVRRRLAELTGASAGAVQFVVAALDAAQVSGQRPLPVSIPGLAGGLKTGADRVVSGLTPAAQRLVAGFVGESSLPVSVLRSIGSPDALDELTACGLLHDHGTYGVLSTPWVADPAFRGLSATSQADLRTSLAAAWGALDPVRAAYHRSFAAGSAEGDGARAALTRAADLGSPWAEALAWTVAEAQPPRDPEDYLVAGAASEQAGHLGLAALALDRALAAEARTPEQTVTLIRRRGLISDLHDDAATALPSARDLDDIARLAPSPSFEARVLAARNAATIGAVGQARRHLTQAQHLGRTAEPRQRALWRLVDCELQQRSAQSVRPELIVECVARWWDASARTSWYDDRYAVLALIDAEEYGEARQRLLSFQSVHRGAGLLAKASALLLTARTEIGDYRVEPALTAVRTLADVAPPDLHLHGLGADLILLEAMAGLPDQALGLLTERSCVADRSNLARARGVRLLVDGAYADAAVCLEDALRGGGHQSVGRRWATLAALLEALVASDPARVAWAYAAYRPPAPESGPGRAAAARCRLLLAAPIEVKHATEEAVRVADEQTPLFYRARALLAAARRYAQIGDPCAAETHRTAARCLFENQGIAGWSRHAAELVLVATSDPLPSAYGQLDSTETKIINLIDAGLHNKDVAEQLFMSLRTLEKALTRIYRKLDVRTKSELLEVLHRAG